MRPHTDQELVINELFGPTFQGEGTSIGRCARFVRLFGCHLSCVWCDSGHTHDASRFDLAAERHVLPLGEVLAWLGSGPPGLVVITGGEPLLQPQALGKLVRAVRGGQLATDIEIETSGTIPPTPEITANVSQFNVSPKLAHAGLRSHTSGSSSCGTSGTSPRSRSLSALITSTRCGSCPRGPTAPRFSPEPGILPTPCLSAAGTFPPGCTLCCGTTFGRGNRHMRN
ncbi:7-carboxy-7-deazaguanine synthase QueE [Streptoalloteichus hindustanus]|uniref:7-carboxy-7-deazaguanine synthase QueE n=1 Tax=Streptoalloteichus hindustanus TaxID=2017 RepID=UPI001F21597F|nr:7-carboxy-7-deazaguanine synthase QueE [Streptoalloteichus hindustanus]